MKALVTELDGLLRRHTHLCVMSYQEQGLGPQFTFYTNGSAMPHDYLRTGMHTKPRDEGFGTF